jgi:hypothetical protein
VRDRLECLMRGSRRGLFEFGSQSVPQGEIVSVAKLGSLDGSSASWGFQLQDSA